jgi:tight adherence protein B
MTRLPFLLIVATFVLTFAIIATPYWLLIARPEEKAKSSLQKRIAMATAGVRAIRVGLLKEVERLSHIPAFDWVLVRTAFIAVPIKRALDHAALSYTVSAVLLASATIGLGAFTIVLRLTHMLSLAALSIPVTGIVPFMVVRFLAQKRLNKLEEQFPEAIDLVARTLRAGHALPTSLQLAAEESPEPTKSEFRILHERHNYGLPLPDALREFAARVPLLDVRFFVTCVLTQREAGGNLTDVLDNLATVIRERFRVKRHVRAVSAHGRTSGLVLSMMPPAMAAIMFVTSPESIKSLLQDPLGQKMLVGAVALQVAGTLIIRRLCKIAY